MQTAPAVPEERRRDFLRRVVAAGAGAACSAAAGLARAARSEAGAGRSFVPPGYRPSFGDDFDDTDVSRINETARGGRPGAPAWRSRYRHERHTIINGEKQVYVDVDYAGHPGKGGAPMRVQPFSIADGVLTITAERADERMASLLGGQRYVSGCITSELTHWQRYGYFEICARLPAGRGFWPAFWLLPKSGTWPPEIDVFEGSGARPRGVHLGIIEKGRSKARPGKRQVDGVIDTTDGFHVYGAEWTAEDVRFFIDGQLQFESGPHQLHEPMYMLANLAVGSKDPNWIPDPDASTPWPGRFEIDHIRAYSRE
ncbi:MAG: glycoside hydrolase family 16 protein [Burkholderiales bacterium]|nr:glycoside hydrolase family 16 protein [Burkholderiales bacterium]